jgi:hypothetical protein
MSSSVEVNGGTRCYQAPELFKMEAKFTRKCDVYAAGVVFLEIVTMRPPSDLVNTFTPKIFGKGLPGCIENCVKSSLSQDPKDRRHFFDLFKGLSNGSHSVMLFAKDTSRFESFLGKVAKSKRQDYESSLNSGRVLDSKGSVLPSRVVSNGLSSVLGTRNDNSEKV